MKLPLKFIGWVLVWLRDIVNTHRFTTAAATVSALGITATYTGTSLFITFAEKDTNTLDEFEYNAKSETKNENSDFKGESEIKNENSALNVKSEIKSAKTSDHSLINRRGLLKSVGNNRCIGVKDGHNRTPLKLHRCSNVPSQTFMIVANDNTLRIMGKCVGIKNGKTKSGTVADLFACKNRDTQKWLITSSGEIVSMKANRCLHGVTNTDDGAIQIHDCDGSANQRWILPEP